MTEAILNASGLIYNRFGEEYVPSVVATVHDLGTYEALYFAFLIWVCAVVVHEFAHWLYLLSINPNAQILIKRKGIGIQLQTGTEEDYVNLTKEQRVSLYLAGILGGLVPIIMASWVHSLYLLVLPAYVVGTFRDMQLIYYVMKEK